MLLSSFKQPNSHLNFKKFWASWSFKLLPKDCLSKSLFNPATYCSQQQVWTSMSESQHRHREMPLLNALQVSSRSRHFRKQISPEDWKSEDPGLLWIRGMRESNVFWEDCTNHFHTWISSNITCTCPLFPNSLKVWFQFMSIVTNTWFHLSCLKNKSFFNPFHNISAQPNLWNSINNKSSIKLWQWNFHYIK